MRNIATVLHFLNADFARRNPAAYGAHFGRLSEAERAGYLSQLDGDELESHVRALGAPVTLGFTLSWAAEVRLEGALAGQPVTAAGWATLVPRLEVALALAERLKATAVTGLVECPFERVHELARLVAMGCQIEVVRLAIDRELQRSEWSLSGKLPRGGALWAPMRRIETGEASDARRILEALAVSLHAVFQCDEW